MAAIEPYGVSLFVIAKTKRMPKDFQIALRKSLRKIGVKLRKDASDSYLEKPKHGRLYLIRRGKRIIKHRASAPGEAPANITGKARRTLGFDVHGYMRLEFGYREREEGKYAKYLETGTGRMAPRPALKLAVNKNEQQITNYFKQEIDKAIKGT